MTNAKPCEASEREEEVGKSIVLQLFLLSSYLGEKKKSIWGFDLLTSDFVLQSIEIHYSLKA